METNREGGMSYAGEYRKYLLGLINDRGELVLDFNQTSALFAALGDIDVLMTDLIRFQKSQMEALQKSVQAQMQSKMNTQQIPTEELRRAEGE